jgi:transcriptional regulator with XRE-family HTH domain
MLLGMAIICLVDNKRFSVALFFDQDWFDKQLERLSASRNDLANALGVTREAIDQIWKDQRELAVADVVKLARFLGVSVAEIADKAGVSTPEPMFDPGVGEDQALMNQLNSLGARLDRLEKSMAEIKALILDLRVSQDKP